MRDIPIHRSKEKPKKLPRKVWASMTKEQKEAYLAYVRLYLDRLDDEQRTELKKKKGY